MFDECQCGQDCPLCEDCGKPECECTCYNDDNEDFEYENDNEERDW